LDFHLIMKDEVTLKLTVARLSLLIDDRIIERKAFSGT